MEVLNKVRSKSISKSRKISKNNKSRGIINNKNKRVNKKEKLELK